MLDELEELELVLDGELLLDEVLNGLDAASRRSRHSA